MIYYQQYLKILNVHLLLNQMFDNKWQKLKIDFLEVIKLKNNNILNLFYIFQSNLLLKNFPLIFLILELRFHYNLSQY